MDRIHPKKAFYRPIWLAWHVISFDHLGGTWAGSEAHAGISLQRALGRGNSLITLSQQQSGILDALAAFAQIPDYRKSPGVIQIPGHFSTYFDRLPEREEKDKQQYQQGQEAQRERARAKFTR